jgi:CBS domain-containing protein
MGQRGAHPHRDQQITTFQGEISAKFHTPCSNPVYLTRKGGDLMQMGGEMDDSRGLHCFLGYRMQLEGAESAAFFVNQLRCARLAALADSEAFDEIIHVVERLGSYLNGKLSDLGKYKAALSELAQSSWLADPPGEFRALVTPFSELYELVRVARNDALHQGASARHLTKHAVELAIILEEALGTEMNPTVGDFMVRNPVCAQLWQPIGFIRQQMLASSYSYLPVLGSGGKWFVVSDVSVARFLGADRQGHRKSKLGESLCEASANERSLLTSVPDLSADARLEEALEVLKDHSVMLVTSKGQKDPPPGADLLGILTAFDLL